MPRAGRGRLGAGVAAHAGGRGEGMELRTLRYFQALAQEGSITNAARVLQVTPPTLSRQLAALEDELGRQLYTRSSRGVELTDRGVMLARYADSILGLAEKATREIALPEQSVGGTVHVAVGETRVVGLLARAMVLTRERYPHIDFALSCGNTRDLMDGLVRGAYDFMLECEVKPHVEFNVFAPAGKGRVGSRGAPRTAICPSGTPCVHVTWWGIRSSRRGRARRWSRCGRGFPGVADELEVVATYNLPLSGRFLVEEGLGAMFTYRGIVEGGGAGGLVFVPLDPPIESTQGLVWRKTTPAKPAQVFSRLREGACRRGSPWAEVAGRASKGENLECNSRFSPFSFVQRKQPLHCTGEAECVLRGSSSGKATGCRLGCLARRPRTVSARCARPAIPPRHPRRAASAGRPSRQPASCPAARPVRPPACVACP